MKRFISIVALLALCVSAWAGNLDRLNSRRVFVGFPVPNGGSRVSTSLNAAYVHLTSGPAVAVRYFCHTADAINELYIFLDAHGGTLGNITMEAQIYNEGAAAARAGTTSRDTSTACAMPDADDKWIKFTFGTPYTPTVGEILWLVAYNTSAAPATDYPQILTTTTATVNLESHGPQAPFVTTNGFSGNGTVNIEMPYVIKHGSDYYGQPFTAGTATYYTNNTLERGMQVTPAENVSVSGAVFSAGTELSDIRILADATAPGGAAIATYDLDSDANETLADAIGAKMFDAPVTLAGGTTYKITVTFSANRQLPAVCQIEDYASYSAVFDAMRAADTLTLPWGVIDNGAGGWTTDKAVCPYIALIVQAFPAIDTPTVGNVQNDDTVRGSAGTLTLPTEAQVESGVTFGAGGTEFTGSLNAGGASPFVGDRTGGLR